MSDLIFPEKKVKDLYILREPIELVPHETFKVNLNFPVQNILDVADKIISIYIDLTRLRDLPSIDVENLINLIRMSQELEDSHSLSPGYFNEMLSQLIPKIPKAQIPILLGVFPDKAHEFAKILRLISLIKASNS